MAKTKTTYRSSNYKFGLNGDLDMNMSMAKSMFPGFFNAQVMMPEIADVLILGKIFATFTFSFIFKYLTLCSLSLF